MAAANYVPRGQMKRSGIIPKLSFPRMGPYKVIRTHDNGTVTIQKEPFVTDRVNIRRVQPYHHLHPEMDEEK